MFPKESKLLLYLICSGTLVIFLVMTVFCMTMIATDNGISLYSHLFSSSNFPRPPLRTVESIFMVISTLKCLFSIFAIHGIRKDIPGLLVPFLGYGAFVVIVMMIMALLLVISGHRLISMILFLSTVLYSSGLSKVYEGYNIMWRANEDLQNLLEDPLIEDNTLIEDKILIEE